jgi:hypothetical protein
MESQSIADLPDGLDERVVGVLNLAPESPNMNIVRARRARAARIFIGSF